MFDQKALDILDGHYNWGETIRWLEEQNLNVPACLAFLFVRHTKLYSFWTMDKLIGMNKNYTIMYGKYADDVEKYLTLI
jgi:hypothetical protein